MTEISERYARLGAAFADRIAAVPPSKWSAPSPCEGWSARDVVAHVVHTQGMFLGFIGQDLGDIPSVDDDPLASWNTARAVVQRNLDDPHRARAEFQGHEGPTTFEAGVDRFLSFDLVVHAWDLARATGQDELIDPADLARAQATAEGFGDAMRAPKAFGPPRAAPAGADAQAHLLAFLGREP